MEIESSLTEQDPMGPSEDRPSPISSALAPLWSTYITVPDAHFLSWFTDVKTPHQMEDVNYLMTMST